jgi:hypothetical protein
VGGDPPIVVFNVQKIAMTRKQIGWLLGCIIVVVITVVVVVVVLTMSSSTIIPSPTVTVVPSPSVTVVVALVSNDGITFAIGDGSDGCYQFQKIASPNVLIKSGCASDAHWVYEAKMKSLAFVTPTYQYCMLSPVATGDQVIGGNSSCEDSIAWVNSTTIQSVKNPNLCVTVNNGAFQWGPCSSSYAFVAK